MTGTSAEAIAEEALTAYDARRQIQPFTQRFADFDIATAYAATARIRRKREARGEAHAGRKIGFTNRSIWQQYNVDCPIWGDVYATTIQNSANGTLLLAPFCEPQIEPEILFRLASSPHPGMNDTQLLDCIEWVAHGFEIVQSIFPGWVFAVPDAIAGFGMHGALVVGPPLAVTSANRAALLDALTRFDVTLSRDGQAIDRGQAMNVLDGPLSALRHLVDLLSRERSNPPLRAGEIVTTGTLTRAFPVRPGESWSTALSHIDLPGLSIRFG